MAQKKPILIEKLIVKLWRLLGKVQRLSEETERRCDLWTKDEGSGHSDTCFKKFVKLLGEFYLIEENVSAATSPLVEDCFLRESMSELGAELEHRLSMGMEARQKYKRERRFYDLQFQFGDEAKEDDEPVDETIGELCIDDEKIENVSISILYLERNWLREQAKLGKGGTSGTKRAYRKPLRDIPPEFRTVPMSQKELAEIWGECVSQKKIASMIASDALNAMQLSRQTFMFDKRDLPPHLIKKLDDIR